MWFYLLACGGGIDTSDSFDTSVTVTDDTGVVMETSLSNQYGWISTETGVATGAAFADVDGDGYQELIVSYGNDIQRGPIAVHDNSEGELERSASWTSDNHHYHGKLDVGDVNRDGLVDLVVSRFLGDAGFSEPGGVDLYINQGGYFESTPSWSYSGVYTFSLALGDVDLDGDLDLAVAVGESYYNAPDRSLLFENSGSSFASEPMWETESDRHSFDVSWADFNGDGMLDLAFANGGSGHTIYYNQGGVFGESPDWEASGDPESFEGNSLAWGDINGDNVLDLVVTENMQQGGSGEVVGWCGPSFAQCWRSEDTPLFQSSVTFEDIDADGDGDLVVGSWWGSVRAYENVSGSLETIPNWQTQNSLVVESIVWSDIDSSDQAVEVIRGDGLLHVPGDILEISGGVAAGGWASGPGEISVTYQVPFKRDMAVTNWENQVGNPIYFWE